MVSICLKNSQTGRMLFPLEDQDLQFESANGPSRIRPSYPAPLRPGLLPAVQWWLCARSCPNHFQSGIGCGGSSSRRDTSDNQWLCLSN